MGFFLNRERQQVVHSLMNRADMDTSLRLDMDIIPEPELSKSMVRGIINPSIPEGK